MNMKSILLGTAAGLMVASAANAADLPGEAAPAAVDYVKVCDTFGAGFFYIPGTETCLDVSGRVRFTVSAKDGDLDDDASGEQNYKFSADARVDFDARTATEYGQLRSFFRIKTGDGTSTAIDKAFIQLGYLTVGYAANFLDSFGGLYGDNDRNQGGSTNLQISVLADNLGGGFYAGLQVRDSDSELAKAFGDDKSPVLEGIVGLTGQAWGSAAVAAAYDSDKESLKVKGSVTANIAEGFAATATATYFDSVSTASDGAYLGLGVSYAATSAATVYANGQVFMADAAATKDTWGVTAGVDYTVTAGLVATAEVTYDDNGTKGTTAGLLRLTRSW